MWIFSFPNTTCCKGILSLLNVFGTWPYMKGLFQGCIFYFVGLCICLHAASHHLHYWSSEVAPVVTAMKPPTRAGDIRDTSSIPGSGRSPGEQRGNTLQYSCLESPHGQRSLAATVHRVTKSLTWLAATAVVSFKIRN